MKSLLALTLLVPSLASAGTCDVGIVALKNEIGPARYNQEVFASFWKRGYDATEVSTFSSATRYTYAGEVTYDCQPYFFNPFFLSTTTTLRVYESATRKTVGEYRSSPQVATGTCKIALEDAIARLPKCEAKQ